jgi:predicted nucleotidyltransferase
MKSTGEKSKALNTGDNLSYRMITKSIKERIKEYFFLNPTAELRVRHIEKKVQVPLPSAIRYAKELEKEDLLKSRVIAGVKLYSAYRGSRPFILEKTFFNIKQLHESGLIEFLRRKYGNPSIVVFGSYSTGDDIESSDIDLFLECSSKLGKTFDKFEKKLQRNIHIFDHKTIKEIKNKHLINNIMNGITLNGQVEVL